MAVIVVGGSGRGVGKTALVCGLIVALREFSWIAIKVTDHAHGDLPAVYEEKSVGQSTDTGRYLIAGARRAFLITSDDASLADRLKELRSILGPGVDVIFESNRILRHVRPDLCLLVRGEREQGAVKPSFQWAARFADAVVSQRECGQVLEGATVVAEQEPKPLFHLAALERISMPMQQWLRQHLKLLG